MTNTTKQADFLPDGARPVAWAAIAFAIALGVAVLFAISRCTHTAPPAPYFHPSPTPAPEALSVAIASSSARAVAMQGIRVTIRRLARRPIPRMRDMDPTGAAFSHDAADQGDEEIVIEATQSVVAEASSSAIAAASASAPVVNKSFTTEHGRLGVIAAIVPGVVAVDLEAVRVDVPAGLVGMPLEVGLDVEMSTRQAGAGVSVGAKAFVEVGRWSRWNLGDRGWYVGAGMRF